MASWQRRGRMVAAVVAVAVVAGAYWASEARRRPGPPPPVTPLEPAVTAQVTGGAATQTSGGRRDFAVNFEKQTTYSDGRTVATGLTVHVTTREGRSFVITGKEGTVGTQQSSVVMTGDVVLTAADGLVARTDTANYADGEGIVRAPGPVTFERGATHGSGVGFTFDKHRDTMVVLDKTSAHVAGAGGEGDMDITAGAFTDARRERYLRLERDARVVRPGQTLGADDMMVYLLPDRDEPDAVELRGRAVITAGTGFGALREMAARDINLDYADDGRTIQGVTLAGEAAIVLAGAGGQAGQRLSAEFVDISLAADGAITRLHARERLLVSLPAAVAAPPRTIRAAELNGDGVAGAGLTAMRFTGGVDFREGAAPAAARTATSETLTVALSTDGVAERATFQGRTAFEDGTLRATAPEARYFMAREALELVGHEGSPPPAVTDTGLQVDAAAIAIALATNGLTATGAVSSVMQPAATRTGSAPARTPALLADDQPIVASAAALEYDSQARRATYRGKARVWQGATNIHAETIVLDEQKGDLTASGKVTSTLSLASGSGAAAPARGTIARAQAMEYLDEARTATYSTGAHMSGPEGDLTADRIALVVSPAGRALERIEGYGTVAAKVAARDARGDRLTYHAADERYVLTGAPVKFTEECRVTTGRTLTFFGTAGKLIVDGNEAARTVTIGGGGRCPATPP